MYKSHRRIVALIVMGVLAFTAWGCSSGGSADNAPQNESEAVEQPAQQDEAEPAAELAPEVDAEQALEEPVEAPTATPGSGTYVGEIPSSAQPYIKEACWWTTQDQTGIYLHAATLMGNTDTVNCFIFPSIRVTAYGDDGTILGTQSLTNVFIAPDDVMPGEMQLTVASVPANVEFEISFGEGEVPGHPYTLASFDITNTSEQVINEHETRWTGQFTNNCDVDFPYGCDAYALLRKDGLLVAGYHAMSIEPVADGQTMPFSVDASFVGEIPEHDSYEVYIVPNLM